MLADTHAHLYWDSLQEDFDGIIKRGLAAGVGIIINVGVDVDSSQTALDQVETELTAYQGLSAYSTIGIHPHEAVKYTVPTNESIHIDIRELEKIYRNHPQTAVAVGECGLDYGFSAENLPSPVSVGQARQLQRELFSAQINLAKTLSLPLLIHVKDDRSKDPNLIEAWDEVFELAGDHFGILHCYSGLPQTTRKTLKSNFLVSFAANITYPKNEYLREAAKTLPLEKIVLETDSPFLPPQSKRGQTNEPSAVKEIAGMIAHLKGVSIETVVRQTTENAKKVLNLNR